MLLLLWACASAPSGGRVVVVGLDGLEYSQLDRMIAAGELPHFARLMREGARANMQVTEPIMSPIEWTTIASGYPAETHGIGGWTDGQGRSFSGSDVRVKRIWDVATEHKKASVVGGWLMSWPATPIEGALLSERFVWSFPMNKAAEKANVKDKPRQDLAFTTFPSSLAATVERPDEAFLNASPLGYQIEAYGAPFHPFPRDETHTRFFLTQWQKHPEARFGAVYLNGADQVSHLYWPFADPTVADQIRRDPSARIAAVAAQTALQPDRRPYPFENGPVGADFELAARYVPDYYRYLDGVVGRVMDVITPDTTLIVCSDHGFRVSSAQPLLNGSHNPTAVFLAWGASVKPSAKADIHIFDVAPTLYALLGLPAAADMPGKLRDDLFAVAPMPPEPSYILKKDASMAAAGASGLADDQLREQLEALGYMSEEDRQVIGASRRQE